MKKLLRIPLLLVTLLLFSIPLSAYDFEVDGIFYKITDETEKTVAVTNGGFSDYYSTMYSGSVSISEQVSYDVTTYSVTSIGEDAFLECSGLTEVNIPNSVTSIGGGAFSGCSGLTEVNIPNSVTSIGGGAFSGCSGLTEVNIPNSVTSIGGGAFSGCSGLTEVNIPNSVTSIGGGAFSGCSGLTSVTIPNSVTVIGLCAFQYCTSLTEFIFNAENCTTMGSNYYDYNVFAGCTNLAKLTIGDKVKTIPDYAFSGCAGLTSVTIPNSVTSIGEYAFYGCIGLTSVTIPNSVTSIGEYAFYGCIGLTSVTIPNSVTSIEGGAFRDCIGLTSVSIPNSVTSIGTSAFYGCTGLTSVTIPNSVTSIESSAFGGCTGLISLKLESGNSVYDSRDNCNAIIETSTNTLIAGCKNSTIPNSVTSIGGGAFSGCTGLTSVTIPNSVTSIGGGAFSGCTGLTSVTIPNSVASIGASAFYGCTGLTSVIIPNSVTSIKYSAFSGCTGLTEVTIEDGTEDLEFGSYVFKNVSLENLYLGRLVYFGDYTYPFSEISTIKAIHAVEIGENITYLFENYFNKKLAIRSLIIKDGSSGITIECDFGTLLDSVYIGRKIYRWQLAGKKYINHVSVGNKVELTSGMFADCDSLQSLTLPYAGAGTVQAASNFGELFGTKSNSNMRAVTQFFEDGTNKTYYLPTGLKSLTLTEGCEMIPYGGLYNCNMLETLTLPSTLYMLGEKALYGCAKMTDIYCKGADPAVAYDNSFDGMRLTSCKLHVPYNSSERYRISDGWKRFYYIEEEAPLVVSVAKSIENAGVVYGINEYQPGQIAEVEAVAHSGYTFVGWYENGTLLTTESKYALVVTDSHSLVAMFAPVLDENDVNVNPQDENVTLSWTQEANATYYSIDIYSDAAMTVKVGNAVVNNSGQPLSRSSMVTTTIDGLSEMLNYYYSITSYDGNDVILSKYIGTFSTVSGVDVIMGDGGVAEVARYDINGRLLSKPAPGINIIKMSDGSIRKEWVK